MGALASRVDFAVAPPYQRTQSASRHVDPTTGQPERVLRSSGQWGLLATVAQDRTGAGPMRGRQDPHVSVLAFIDLEEHVPPAHPPRLIEQVEGWTMSPRTSRPKAEST